MLATNRNIVSNLVSRRIAVRNGSLAFVRALCWIAFMVLAASASAQHMGLVVRDAKSPPGAEVTSVTPGTPAANAELQPGDVIVQVQGAVVRSADEFVRAAHAVRPATVAMLRVSRGGWEKDVQLQAPAARMSFGVAVGDSPGQGVAIASVDPGGAAADAGLASGDRLLRVDGRAIADVRTAQIAIEDAASRQKALALTVERNGWAKEVVLVPKAVAPQESHRAAVSVGGPRAPAGAAAPSISGDMDEANQLYEAGNWREAEAAYRRVNQAMPDQPRVWGRLCHVLVMQERFGDAVDTCQRAALLAPAEAGIFQNIGYSYSRLGRYPEAIVGYQRAIDVAPDLPAPYAGIAGAYVAQRNWAKAEEYYRLTLARDPKSGAAWQALGDAAGEQGKSAEAIAHYRKALEVGPANASMLSALGWHLYRAGRHGEAETALVEANRMNPNDVTALVSLGSVEEKLGKLSEAKQAWQRASELDPAGPAGAIARRNLATVMGPSSPPPTAVAAGATGGPVAIPPGPVAAEPSTTGAPRPPGASAQTLPPPQGGVLKAAIAIGDFQAKAANASQHIGDGLREMLLTELHNSGRFVVMERMDIRGLAAEQALSRSRMARPGEAIPEGQMEVADVMVYGAVTEFEPEVRGGGLTLGMPNVPLTLGMQSKSAHMAIDVRLVDVASGRVLATGRLVGQARSTQASIGANISTRGVTMPATLGGFSNTPMEQAIRECIAKAIAYITGNTPPSYFHHS